MTENKETIGQPVFSTLVHSIASSALMAMGMVPKMKDKKNKALAEFNIDLLSLLKEKTKNNLTSEEEKLLNNCIQDLQMMFVQTMTKDSSENPSLKSQKKENPDESSSNSQKTDNKNSNKGFMRMGLCAVVLLFSFLFFYIPAEGFNSSSSKNSFQTDSHSLASLPLNVFVKLAKKINPTVVNISTTKDISLHSFSGFEDPFFHLFFGRQALPPETKPMPFSLGAGFIIDSKGLIATNTHVIQKADGINVQLMNSQKLYPAKVIGKDTFTDVALIQIKTDKPLPSVRLGKSSDLQIGEWVAAFGNPYGHGHTMTKGIISAVNREIDELNLFPFLQTDASINPGNSGGPLVNLKGEVIGINTAMRAHGISFAIPIDNAKAVLQDLQKHGRVRRGFIGVQLAEDLSSKPKVVKIVKVLADSPAEKTGLKPYDIIIEFNKKKIKSYTDLLKNVATSSVDKPVPIKIKRNGRTMELMITVQEITAKKRQKASYPQPKKYPEPSQTLGLTMTMGNKQTLISMGLPPLNRPYPVVTHVAPSSPADLANIRKKDIIVKVNNRDVRSINDIRRGLFRNRINSMQIIRYRPYSNQYVRRSLKLKL